MPIPFGRLGLPFRLFSTRFYPPPARRAIAAFIGKVAPPGLVLDIGGGTGAMTEIARPARPGLTYACVDPAPGMLAYARPPTLRVAARAEGLPFAPGAAQAVMVGDALHHFGDVERAMEEIYRVLAPGGMLFVFDLDPRTLMGRIVAGAERLAAEPARFYRPGDLAALLEKKGFEVGTVTPGFRYTMEAKKGEEHKRTGRIA